eukprot:TRINITY_DN6375_c0_g1_i1.p1 TRINITY_DN6375_c0_g1~~TRINITY_DN6375_c0_g1_i1.p1  ORF type:complete len:349 (+),score=101.22 TRINITY_DN6375_c0_g1_i1:91-1137(+)
MERLVRLEYYQWRLSRRVLGVVTGNLPPHSQGGARKALEVFLMASYARGAEWPPLYSASLQDPKFAKKLEGDLARVGAPDAAQRVAEVLEEVRRAMHRRKTAEDRPLPVQQRGGTLRVGKYACDYKGRVKLLACWGGLDAVAALALRYSAALAESVQWAVPPDVYEIFRTELGCLGEGYASPLNSHMLPHQGGVFCSAFPDIDRHFNSRGSLYDINGAAAARLANGWVLNPPFTLHHLNSCAQHAAGWLQRQPELRVVVVGRSHNTSSSAPEASHSKPIQMTSPYAALEPYVQATLHLPPGAHHYIANRGQVAVASFPSSIYICGPPLEDQSVVQRVEHAFRAPAASA